MRFKLPAALAALVALAAAGCGSDNDTGGDATVAGNGTDRAFVAAMVPHHQSAVEMAKIAQQRGESAFVDQLADDIVTTQTEEIATLRREDEALDTAGVEKGSLGVTEHAMGMNDDPAELRTAQPFDESFLQMMVPHHEGAIEMANAELAKGQDPELKALAQQIIDAQEREISEMREHLGMDRLGRRAWLRALGLEAALTTARAGSEWAPPARPLSPRPVTPPLGARDRLGGASTPSRQTTR